MIFVLTNISNMSRYHQTLAGSSKYNSLLSISIPAKVCGLWAFFGDLGMFTENELKRFWDKVDKSGDCWLWTASINQHGYGAFIVNETRKFTRKTHRISWMIANGEVPDGMQINHKCDVRHCVNPEHLYCGTPRDNMLDMYKRKRNAKLKASDIPIILSYKGKLTAKEIAKMYGVKRRAIQSVLNGERWSNYKLYLEGESDAITN